MAMNKARIDFSAYLPDTPILSAAETARLMGFSSREALGKARVAGRLGIDMFKLSGRRGWFAHTDQVREWLEASGAPNNSDEEGTQ